jgi:ribosomal protein S14
MGDFHDGSAEPYTAVSSGALDAWLRRCGFYREVPPLKRVAKRERIRLAVERYHERHTKPCKDCGTPVQLRNKTGLCRTCFDGRWKEFH